MYQLVGYTSNEHPGYRCGPIISVLGIPQPPNLVSQLLVNEQGFDVEFGEHVASMTGRWVACLVRS